MGIEECAVVEINPGRCDLIDLEIKYGSKVPTSYSSKSYFVVSGDGFDGTDQFRLAVQGEINGLTRDLRREPSLEEIQERLNSKATLYQTTPIDYALRLVVEMPKTDVWGMPINPADD